MNKKLLLSGKQIQQIQPRLTPRGFSVELLHTDSAEDTGLELENVIIKKEHPSLLFQFQYLQPIITQYFIDNKSEIWLLFLIAHPKR